VRADAQAHGDLGEFHVIKLDGWHGAEHASTGVLLSKPS
jgi:hypothetical protein